MWGRPPRDEFVPRGQGRPLRDKFVPRVTGTSLNGTKTHTLKQSSVEARTEKKISRSFVLRDNFMYDILKDMAPEMGVNKYSKKIDVYSFGVLLYELVHKKEAFTEYFFLGVCTDWPVCN